MFNTMGGGRSFPEYAIHQLEMIVAVMGTEVQGIELVGDAGKLTLCLKYSNSRLASASYAADFPYAVSAASAQGVRVYSQTTGYWANFTNALLDFFATGISPIRKEETLCIADLLEKSVALLNKSKI